MSALGSLKLVSAVRINVMSPIQFRRNKLSAKLVDQIALAKAMKDGTTYAPKRVRSVKDRITGEVKTIEQTRKVRQWWFRAESGKTCVQLRYGAKVLDFAKGKNAIEVASEAELVSVLESLKKACELGELDAQMTTASEAVRKRFKR
jgi:hypothetical protein